jgi:hypothetical protein
MRYGRHALCLMIHCTDRVEVRGEDSFLKSVFDSFRQRRSVIANSSSHTNLAGSKS